MGAADASGLVVSYIQSLYWEFGSGVVLPATGVLMQNRGASFSLEPGALNALAPGRLPFHTLNPALAVLARRPYHRLRRHGRRWPAANAGRAVHPARALPRSRSSARSMRRAGCSAAPGARPTPICAWNRASTATLVDRLLSAGHDVEMLAGCLFGCHGPCRGGGAAPGRYARRRPRSARRRRRGRGVSDRPGGYRPGLRMATPPFRRSP